MKRRVARAALYLALNLVALEVGLQIAGLAAPGILFRPRGGRVEPDTITILCVGDSHTYGAPLPADESYPAQLQALLTDRYPGRAFNVLNFGVPGVNSAFVANRLERHMLQVRPHLVIVWVGLNNVWNALETEVWNTSDRWLALRRLLLRVKLVRLGAVLWHTRPGARAAPAERREGHFVLGGEQLRAERRANRLRGWELRPGIEFDMTRMVATARELQTPILFVNYPLPYPIVTVIRTVGAQLNVPVIDTIEELWRAKRDGYTSDDLMVMAAGPHPRRILYAYVVQAMVPEVAKALKERYGIDLDAPAPR